MVIVAIFLWRAQIRDAYVEWVKPVVPSEQPLLSTTPAIGAVNLAVPFFSQAPRGDWSEPWQNACEESSVILVGAYWTNEELTTDTMAQHILDAVAWENQHFGYYQETTAAQTAQMLRALYGFSDVRVQYDVGIEDIVRNVRAGRPVIVPLAGQLLGNPYYVQPGPLYHMLVVKGVTESGDIITNDVGTRHGKNYVYKADVFLNAMHDAPQGGASFQTNSDFTEYIKTGRRAMIVVYPN